MGTPSVEVGEVRGGRGHKVVSGERTALTTETEEGLGAREGGVGLEPEDGGEEIGSSKVGGDEGDVCLTTTETWKRQMVGR